MKKKVLGILVLLLAFAIIPTVFAVTTLVAPAASGTFSGTTMIFNVTTDISVNGTNPLNVTIYYNVSGGATGTVNELVAITNTTGNVEFYNGTVVISTLADSTTYNFSARVSNGATQEWTSNSGITINNTAAGVSFTTTVNNGNYSGTITLNVTVAIGTVSVFFNVTYTNGSQLNYSLASNSSATNFNLSLDTTGFTDGLYNVTAYVNNSLNNQNNSEFIQIRMDNTAPIASMSCTPSSVTAGSVVTCSCSPTDSGSGVNTSATSVTEKPTTSNTGTFTESCSYADLAGNTGSTSPNGKKLILITLSVETLEKSFSQYIFSIFF